MNAQVAKIIPIAQYTPIPKGKNLVPSHVSADNVLPKAQKLRPAARVALDPANFDPGVDNGPDLALLVEMLTYMRPGGSKWDEDFTNKFIVDRLGDVHTDGYTNHWFQVGSDPEIMWTCHTDTVHRLELANASKGRQEVALEGGKLVLADPWGKASNCLGADDTAGIWLMLEMIRANVPGLYVFFRDEEIGGLGSSWAAKNVPNWFSGIKACIALDRKGKDSVITHQGCRTASDAFAKSLAAALGQEMGFNPDPTGIFTDTANLTDLVGECSNLSVGYAGAHGPTESLEVQFLIDLRKALIEADFTGLVFERKPGEVDADDYFARKYSDWQTGYRSHYGFDDELFAHDRKGRSKKRSKKRDILVDGWGSDYEDEFGTGRTSGSVCKYQPWGDRDIRDFVTDNPGLVADFLEFNGFDIEALTMFAEDMDHA